MPSTSAPKTIGIALWALGPVALCLIEAIARLGARALRTIDGGLAPVEWLALAAVTVTLCYVEGYRALQRRFAPASVARAFAIDPCDVMTAPLRVVGLLGGDRREVGRAWLGAALILGAALSVRWLPAPWRGIVDAGVAAALLWGLVALVGQFLSAALAATRARYRKHPRASRALGRA
jgi:hypothetical protein